jgi:hypothetical protein
LRDKVIREVNGTTGENSMRISVYTAQVNAARQKLENIVMNSSPAEWAELMITAKVVDNLLIAAGRPRHGFAGDTPPAGWVEKDLDASPRGIKLAGTNPRGAALDFPPDSQVLSKDQQELYKSAMRDAFDSLSDEARKKLNKNSRSTNATLEALLRVEGINAGMWQTNEWNRNDIEELKGSDVRIGVNKSSKGIERTFLGFYSLKARKKLEAQPESKKFLEEEQIQLADLKRPIIFALSQERATSRPRANATLDASTSAPAKTEWTPARPRADRGAPPLPSWRKELEKGEKIKGSHAERCKARASSTGKGDIGGPA